MEIKAIRGTKDILPDEAQIWRHIEREARGLFTRYGYLEIRTPILEEARLFTRSIGTSSDIVRKEMYSFLDRKHRLLCLRPEATASVVRAYLEHNLDKQGDTAKLYYIGPMFRAERPQAGRLRQFHHLGAEAIGSFSPYLDAEVILLAIDILTSLKVKGWKLHLNSLGCQKDREEYKAILKGALKDKLTSLCSDCQARHKLNILRIFDCKNPDCKKIILRLPAIGTSLCSGCKEHFLKVENTLRKTLRMLDLYPNQTLLYNPRLVRGLDYYTGTCFEIIHPALGAQNALGAGGRYDNLLSDLGGPKKPAIGFALGVERIIAALENKMESDQSESLPSVYISTIGDQVKEIAFELLCNLRAQGIPTQIDYSGKSLKGQMRQADKLQANYVAMLGETELSKQVVTLRDMRSKEQKQVKISQLPEVLKKCCALTPAAS